jgi:hypothetical protein
MGKCELRLGKLVVMDDGAVGCHPLRCKWPLGAGGQENLNIGLATCIGQTCPGRCDDFRAIVASLLCFMRLSAKPIPAGVGGSCRQSDTQSAQEKYRHLFYKKKRGRSSSCPETTQNA